MGDVEIVGERTRYRERIDRLIQDTTGRLVGLVGTRNIAARMRTVVCLLFTIPSRGRLVLMRRPTATPR